MRFAAAVLFTTLAASATGSGTATHLPIINDDYARARAEATQRHLPLFVEVWAPW
ncbi:MAG TPA: hypothetical protein VMJ70_14235 [Candidatus Sulfotelmatobacter sp.]|nr:hypothetical protein [Candidatus Sulfotelmatobacter sp.]